MKTPLFVEFNCRRTMQFETRRFKQMSSKFDGKSAYRTCPSGEMLRHLVYVYRPSVKKGGERERNTLNDEESLALVQNIEAL